MKLAYLQAQKVLGKTKKNPAVGCVIVKNNFLVSAGHTGINGTPHAEYNAIKTNRLNIKKSDLYVTLEPCSNYGKTPPCTKLIINNKIKKVFFSINDPDIRSFKKSHIVFKKRRIRSSKGVLKKEMKSFYRSYIKFKNKGLPFVTAKFAISRDYYSINKKKKWITNKFSRGRVHLLRSMHDCILTSCSTVNTDNPQLTCRINGLEQYSPARIILDKNLRIKKNSKIIKEAKKYKTIIFYNKGNNKKINLIKRFGVRFTRIPIDINKNLNLIYSLEKIKKLGYSRIFLESGIKLTTAFLKENLVDDFFLFVSRKKINKNGDGNFRKILTNLLNKKKRSKQRVYLFGDKLILFKIK